MLSLEKLIQAFNAGQVELIKKELDRYGVIVSDAKWQETEGHYKGQNRATSYEHYARRWVAEMLDGEVISLSYDSL